MDETRFDALTRSLSTTTAARSRRGVLGLAAAALATATGAALPFVGEAADDNGPDASRKKGGKGKKNKRCRKANQTCGGKKKCCKGLACTDGRCAKKTAPECADDGDCGANEECQNGTCVPVNQPECTVDDDCDFNETCDGGTCQCDLRVNGTCVRRCANNSDAQCPGPASCRNHFPADGPGFEDGVCVDEAFFLCDTASCQTSGDSGCQAGEICVAMECGAIGVTTFRCQDIAVGNDFEN